MINLRSDTVSKPTEGMRKAMAEAEVGDDYYREDPTVIALEEKAASLFGKEAAMMVFSATMSNVVSVLSHTRRGQSIILEERSHIYNNEGGFLSAFGGLTPRTIRGERGRMVPEQVEAAQSQLGRTQAGALVEQTLAAIARGLVDNGVRRLIVAGGETSGAVVETLGISCLEIGPEIDPGVPWTRALDGQELALALKSGNFGGTRFFLKALDMLA